jgi:hypothetical protein
MPPFYSAALDVPPTGGTPMTFGPWRRLPIMKATNLAQLYDLAPLDWDTASTTLPAGRRAISTSVRKPDPARWP